MVGNASLFSVLEKLSEYIFWGFFTEIAVSCSWTTRLDKGGQPVTGVDSNSSFVSLSDQFDVVEQIAFEVHFHSIKKLGLIYNSYHFISLAPWY